MMQKEKPHQTGQLHLDRGFFTAKPKATERYRDSSTGGTESRKRQLNWLRERREKPSEKRILSSILLSKSRSCCFYLSWKGILATVSCLFQLLVPTVLEPLE